MSSPLIKVRRTALINPDTAPRLYKINQTYTEPQTSPPGVGGAGVLPFTPRFRPDGFIYPLEEDQRFDFTARQPAIPENATTELDVFNTPVSIKGGWIRWLGYGFNNPLADFLVRTFVLIDDSVPSDYLWRTVDPTGAFEGSFPTVNVGSIQEPTEVYIRVPAQAKISIRWVNNSQDTVFSGTVRLKGWFHVQ